MPSDPSQRAVDSGADAAGAAIEERDSSESAAALRHIKEVAIRGLELPIEERIKLAREFHLKCLQTEDAREGLRAFAWGLPERQHSVQPISMN